MKDISRSVQAGDQQRDARLQDGMPDYTKEPAAPAIKYRWSLDTSFEYRNFKRPDVNRAFQIVQAGHDQHAYIDDFFLTEHLGYVINEDLSVGLGGGFRHLRKLNVDDADRLGEHDFSDGMIDPEFDVKYRFKRQTQCFPLDLAVYGVVQAPLGRTHEKLPSGEFFETEDQPGTGAWAGTLGIAGSHGWDKWGASFGGSYTLKGVGARHFKEGDVGRLSISGSRLISPAACRWKLYASLGVQGLIERKAEEDGHKDGDHGGQTIFVLPGIAAKPIDRLVLSLSVPVPVYQEENGSHQKQNYAIQLGMGVRF